MPARSPSRVPRGAAARRVLAAAAAAGVLLHASPLRAQASRPSAAALAGPVDSLVADYQRATGAPGVSVAVIRAGRDTLVYKGYGLADIENDVPATPLTVYRIGSITKQFTAAAVLQLAERGRLSLDASLGSVLPQVPAPWRAVTVRQLLNHTSGIRSYTGIGPKWQRRMRDDMAPDSIVALVYGDTLDFAPGARWRYNNTGYVLLGMIVEKVSGQAYAEYLGANILRPLGLAETRYCDVAPVVRRRARGYEGEPGAVVNASYLSMTQPYAAGSLCSTVGDLAAWNRALATGRVVKADSWTRMTAPEGAAAASHYGYGIVRDTVGGRRMLAHGGGINGFITMNGYVPDDSLSVTVLTNFGSADPGRLHDKIVRAALGLPVPGAVKAVALSAAERARYVGRYTLTDSAGRNPMPIRVFEERGALMGQLRTNKPSLLLHEGEGAFRPADAPDFQLVFTPAGARATGVAMRGPKTSMQGVRDAEAGGAAVTNGAAAPRP